MTPPIGKLSDDVRIYFRHISRDETEKMVHQDLMTYDDLSDDI